MNNYTKEIEKIPFGKGVEVVSINEDGLIALEKPAGLMSHPNRSKDEKYSLINARYDLKGEFYIWENEDGTESKAWLLNRLDSATSGLLLLTLNEALKPIISDLFLRHKVFKGYYAIVRGSTKLSMGIWENTFQKVTKTRAGSKKGIKSIKAKTKFQKVRSVTGGFPMSLMKLFPITGRTHQLRIQCRKNKLPICGDKTYGSFRFNRDVKSETGIDRLMLHSFSISFEYFYDNKRVSFTAQSEMPAIFEGLLSYRPGMDFEKLFPKLLQGKTTLKGRRFNA